MALANTTFHELPAVKSVEGVGALREVGIIREEVRRKLRAELNEPDGPDHRDNEYHIHHQMNNKAPWQCCIVHCCPGTCNCNRPLRLNECFHISKELCREGGGHTNLPARRRGATRVMIEKRILFRWCKKLQKIGSYIERISGLRSVTIRRCWIDVITGVAD